MTMLDISSPGSRATILALIFVLAALSVLQYINLPRTASVKNPKVVSLILSGLLTGLLICYLLVGPGGLMQTTMIKGVSSTPSTIHSTLQASDLNPGRESSLVFDVSDSKTRQPIKSFQILNTQLAHLVILDDSLNYFDHIHPQVSGSKFKFKHNFPKTGTYRLYLSYAPTGGMEQQEAFKVNIGSPSVETGRPTQLITTKAANGYIASFDANTYSASKFTNMQQMMHVTVTTADGAPVTNLKPYLGAFGHLVMINQETNEYLHVHPISIPSSTNPSGGPKVTFHPMKLAGFVQPGTYRVFLELKPDDKLMRFDFRIEVKP